MKIISKYKDFYDHISYLYGIDEKIVYVRDTINNTEIRARSLPGHRKLRTLQDRLYKIDHRVESSIVVVVDRMFFVVRNIGTNKEHVLDNNDELFREGSWLFRDRQSYSSEEILSMTKLVGVPVYRIKRFWSEHSNDLTVAVVDKQVPHLCDIEGIVGLLGIEQTYQNISYALTNQLRDSPDVSPPIVVDDKYKITAAGFDLKQSFRHRK